jgi:DNA repair protein RadD
MSKRLDLGHHYTLRPYQREAVDAAVSFLKGPSRHNSIEVLPTGSGKSLIIANVVKDLGEPVLVFQPSREILEQNLSKLASYGYQAAVYSASKGRTEVGNITLATIGSVIGKTSLFDNFRYIIVDECFPAGTKVDGKPIEKIRVGDMVNSVNHNTGVVEPKMVARVFRNRARAGLITIRLSDGSSFCCTDNHPIWIKSYGYLPAKVLSSLCINAMSLGGINEQKEDLLLQDMWKRVSAKKPHQDEHLLQPGMCSGGPEKGSSCDDNCLLKMREGDHDRGHSENQLSEDRKGLLFNGVLNQCPEGTFPESGEHIKVRPGMEKADIGENEKEKSNVDAGDKGENDRVHEGQEVCCQRREWTDYEAAGGPSESHGVNNRIPRNDYSRESRLSFCPPLLQGGLSGAEREVGCRGGRQESQTPVPEVARLKEDGSIEFLGVDSVEVHERGSGQQFERLCPDNYVYNIEVEDNHNYFVNNILVHNCHLVNAKEGMYKTFLEALMESGTKVLGLTATPYRLATNSYGPELRFLTRTRPRVFREMIYYVQNRQLFDHGYLARIEYATTNGFDRAKLQINSTGADFTDESVQTYLWASNLPVKLVDIIQTQMKTRKNVLVFTRFVKEAQYLVHYIPGSAIVTGETPKKERARIIDGFKRGDIPVVANVGVLTTGFDYPELETVIIARPTMSLALYYQMIGRCTRPHPLKDYALVIDMCGNYESFGKVEDLEIVDGGNGKWFIASGGKQLTNVYYGEKQI